MHAAAPARPAADGRDSRRSVGPDRRALPERRVGCASFTSLRRRSARAAYSAAASATRSSWRAPWLRQVDCELITFGRRGARRARSRWSAGADAARPWAGRRPSGASDCAGLVSALVDDAARVARRPHPSYAQLAEPYGGGDWRVLVAQGLAVTDHGLQGFDWARPAAAPVRPVPDRLGVLGSRAGRAAGPHAGDLRRRRSRSATRPILSSRRTGRPVRRPPDAAQRRRSAAAGPAGGRASCVSSAQRATIRDYPNATTRSLLQRLARDQDVQFAGTAADGDLPGLYRSAQCHGPAVGGTDRAMAATSACPSCSAWSPWKRWPAARRSSPAGRRRARDRPATAMTGFLVPPGDVAALHDRLDQLLRDPALRQRLGAERPRGRPRAFHVGQSGRALPRGLLGQPDS